MARRTRLSASQSTPEPAPVIRRGANPLAWERALSLANGDARRLRILADGAVLVLRRRTSA